MSQEPDNGVLLQTLLGIKEDLGELRSDVKTFHRELSDHIEDDKKLSEQIKGIDDAQKRIKWIAMGAAGVLTGAWKFAEALLRH